MNDAVISIPGSKKTTSGYQSANLYGGENPPRCIPVDSLTGLPAPSDEGVQP